MNTKSDLLRRAALRTWPAGLACAASLGTIGLRTIIFEKSNAVGAVWHRHYDRLHLHTDRGHSALPGLPMPKSFPRYPSRAQFLQYLEAYAEQFALRPVFNSEVLAIRRKGERWQVETADQTVSVPMVVVATGWADYPNRPAWPGLREFRGEVIHSSEYRNPTKFAGKRILVVGFGNSGSEIALDLAEHKVDVALSVRGGVQILPRDLLDIPILAWAIAQRHLPARVSDFINAPIIRLAVGSIEKLGLQRASKGPRRMIEEEGRVPVLDIGAVARIRDGSIRVRGAIEHFTPEGVKFAKSGEERFDAVILATGFRPDLGVLLPDSEGVLDEQGMPLVTGRATNEPGLYFCGQIASPTGQLREIGIEATHIALLAKRYLH